jgi:hypothetical protein
MSASAAAAAACCSFDDDMLKFGLQSFKENKTKRNIAKKIRMTLATSDEPLKVLPFEGAGAPMTPVRDDVSSKWSLLI